MSEQAGNSRRWLRSLCRVGTVVGWVLIASFPLEIWGTLSIAYSHPGGIDVFRQFYLAVKQDLIAGCLVLGAVQFVRYLSDQDHEPRKLLRSFHLVLFGLAGGFLIRDIVVAGMMSEGVFGCGVSSLLSIPAGSVAFLTGLLPGLAQALMFVGTGLAIRLALPIIAESKTLA